MKVVLFAPNIDATDVGEALVAYKWANALSQRVELTVLAFQRPGRAPLAEQLPDAKVITWPEPAFFLRFERMNAGLKPGYPLLYWAARRWLRQQIKSGQRFDICHQLMPQAARYPALFYGLGIPYVLGPLGGALPTPKHFRLETGTESWFTRLRIFDTWRFRYDPWLRRSYAGADLVLGVAPYMRERLDPIPLKRFEPLLELGIEVLAPERPQKADRQLRLLHVGRGVRTKGLRDIIRALALLPDLPEVTLTSAGGGGEIALCRTEAIRLGVSDRVTFLGQIPHDEVETLYRDSDIFTFPSFREPAGGVLYEALRWGLPVITVDYGGPAHIIDGSCGIRLPLSTPEALAHDIAEAVRTLHGDPNRRVAMGQAARARVTAEGLWKNKVKRLLDFYESVLADQRASALPVERGGKRE